MTGRERHLGKICTWKVARINCLQTLPQIHFYNTKYANNILKPNIQRSFSSTQCVRLTHWIPGRHDDATVIRTSVDSINDLSQLVHTLPRIVSMHVRISRSKVPPLEPIHWSKVTCTHTQLHTAHIPTHRESIQTYTYDQVLQRVHIGVAFSHTSDHI